MKFRPRRKYTIDSLWWGDGEKLYTNCTSTVNLWICQCTRTYLLGTILLSMHIKLWPSLHFTSILLGRKNDLPHGLKGRFNRATRAFANLFWREVLSIPLFNRSQRRFIRLMNPTKKLAKVDIYLLYICKHNYRCCRSWFTLFYQIKFMFTTWQ